VKENNYVVKCEGVNKKIEYGERRLRIFIQFGLAGISETLQEQAKTPVSRGIFVIDSPNQPGVLTTKIAGVPAEPRNVFRCMARQAR
jgi:hypothetical protein